MHSASAIPLKRECGLPLRVPMLRLAPEALTRLKVLLQAARRWSDGEMPHSPRGVR